MSTSTNNIFDFQYTAGLDVGNGYVKGLIERTGDSGSGSADVVDMPSVVAKLTRQVAVPDADSEAPKVVADDFFNATDVTIASPLIGDAFRRLAGRRALSARGVLDEFELVGHKSKSEQGLSKALVLGIVAAKAVKDHVAATGSLPRERALTAHVVAALALPINEFVRHRLSYAAAFTGAGTGTDEHTVHQVTLNNFETPVTVRIVFDDVTVIAEGASAMYAINSGGEKLMTGMLADVRARGLALEGITAKDVLAATDTIGVDVGEGTVNFPVFTSGKFNTDASRALDKGYGTVLEDALQAMEDEGVHHGFSGRKALAEYLQAEPSPLKRNFHAKVVGYVEREAAAFNELVADEFGRVLEVVGAQNEVAYVYGGGAGALKAGLAAALQAKAQEMNSEDAFPVLYLDASYSRKLNREGLALAARTRARLLSEGKDAQKQAGKTENKGAKA